MQETDPLKRLWFNPVFKRIRMNPWILAAAYFLMICVIGVILMSMMAMLKVLGAALPIIVGIAVCIVLIRYTVFKDR